MLNFAQRAALEANDLLKDQAAKIKNADERAEQALHRAGAEAAAAAAATDAAAALEKRLLHLGEQVAQLSATAMAAEEVAESETAALASEALEAAAADVAETKVAASDAAEQFSALVDMLLDENNLLHRELDSGGQARGDDVAEVPSVSRGVERVAPLKVCAQIPGAAGDCLRNCIVQIAYMDHRFYHQKGCVTPDAWMSCLARSEKDEDDERMLKCWDEVFAKGACYAEIRSFQTWALIASSDQGVPASMTATEPKAPAVSNATSSVLSRLIGSLRTLGGMVRSETPMG